MRRFLVIALLAIACHRSSPSPTEPSCRPVMGALGDTTVSGYVIMRGEPVANAHIRFVQIGSGNVYGARTDSRGFYHEGDMWHGNYRYTVTLENQNAPYVTDPVTLACGDNMLPITLD